MTTINAVDNASFTLNQSEIVSVVGESGSGKTSLARCIMLLNKPTSGSIKFNDVDVTSFKRRHQIFSYLRNVQMIYQDPFESLNPRHDVFTTISMPIRQLTGEKQKSKLYDKASRLLKEVGLNPDELMYRFPHQLSGGQRQRVNIARALAPSPSLLIADEPITMLDAAQRLNILSLLMELKNKRNLTILMITHDMASARLLGGRMFVLYLGKLVELGDTEEIFTKPHHPYVEMILDATPQLTLTPEKLNYPLSWIEESELVKSGCIFRPRCKYATEVCRNVEPPLDKKSKTHFAACHNPLNSIENN